MSTGAAVSHKVVVARLSSESNSFAPGATTLESFQKNQFGEGPSLLTLGGGKDTIGGALQVANSRRIELIPTTYAATSSGPPVTAEAFAYLRDRLLDGLRPYVGRTDGVYLSLHGAMMADGVDDTEGAIIAQVRDLMGEHVPIAVSFDLHAHFTARIASLTSLVAGYQTCPHIDMFETGARAMQLLAAAIEGRNPTLRYRKVPMISSSEAHDTGSGPVSDVFARLHEIERDSGVLDASLFLTQPWFDAPEVGWTSVVVTDDDPALAQRYADELAEMVWNRRRSTFVTKTPIPAALSEVVSSPRSARPFVLADCADSPSAGSSGDGVSLLAALLAEPVDDVVLLTVTDPGAVEACFTAGVDGEVQTTVGGSCATEWFAAVPVHGRVETLADGRFTGRYSPGPAYVGRVAVLAVGSMKLVITEYPASMLDYQLYLRVGLQPSEAKIVQVKSAGGYRAYYGPLAHRMIDLETSGPSGSDLASMPFVRVSRPLWPFDTAIETPW